MYERIDDLVAKIKSNDMILKYLNKEFGCFGGNQYKICKKRIAISKHQVMFWYIGCPIWLGVLVYWIKY